MVDPYQLVKAEGPKRASKMPWQRLLLFDGHTERISPAMMLDMMHTLRTTISTIMEAAMVYGYAVPADRMNRNVLLHLHRKTIERYKECVFQEGCPTIHEIEVLMHRLVEPHNGHRPGPEGKVQACATVETDVP